MPDRINLPSLVTELAIDMSQFGGQVGEATRRGSALGEALGRSMQQRLTRAVRSIPDIQIDANSSQADRDIADVRRRLEDLSARRIGVDLDTGEALREAEELQVHLDRLSRTHPDVAVRTQVGEAVAELESVRAAARRVDGERARVHVDTQGVGEALVSLAKVSAALGALSAIPAGAAAAAGLGALAAAAASAGVAVGAFAAAAKPQLSDVADAADLYSKAQDAQAEGGKKAAAAQKEYRDALKDLPPATRTTAKAFIGLKNDFTDWSDSLSSSTMPVFTAGIDKLRGLLPKLSPVVKTASGVLKEFVDGLGKGDSGKVFDQLGDSINRFSGPTLRKLLGSLKNVGTGFAGLLDQFAPVGAGMADGLEKITRKFADFGTHIGGSSGFTSFMDYVKEQGPAVVDFLRHIGEAGGHLVQALGPLGGTTLKIADGFAMLLSAIPTDVLEAVAAVLPAIVVAVKGWAIAQALLNVALDANPIGLVVTALAALATAVVYLWKKFTWFRVAITTIFAAIATPPLMFAKIALQAFKLIANGLLEFVQANLELGAKAFGWIPGIGSKLKTAAAAVKGFRDDTSRFFDGAIKKVDGWKKSILSMPQKVALKGDISDLTKKINKAKVQLGDRNLPKGKRAKLTANIDDWNAKLIAAKTRLEETPAKKKAMLTASIKDWQAKVDKAEHQLITAKGQKKATLTANIADWKSKINAASNQLRTAPNTRKAILTGNIKDWTAKINTAKAQLKHAPSSKKAVLRADISNLQRNVRNARAELNSLRDRTVTVTTVHNEVHVSRNGFGAGHFAAGGVVPGYAPRVDRVPALLSPGEGVLVPETVRKLGAATVTALNAWGRYGAKMPRLPRFADGGVVPRAPSSDALMAAYTAGPAPQPVVINVYGGGDSRGGASVASQIGREITWRSLVGRRP